MVYWFFLLLAKLLSVVIAYEYACSSAPIFLISVFSHIYLSHVPYELLIFSGPMRPLTFKILMFFKMYHELMLYVMYP